MVMSHEAVFHTKGEFCLLQHPFQKMVQSMVDGGFPGFLGATFSSNQKEFLKSTCLKNISNTPIANIFHIIRG